MVSSRLLLVDILCEVLVTFYCMGAPVLQEDTTATADFNLPAGGRQPNRQAQDFNKPRNFKT